MRRMMWSRTPDKFEIEIVTDYIQDLARQNKDVSKYYIYVNLDTEDGGIEIVNYPVKSIEVVARELECSEREALYCVAVYPGFLSELRECLYWNDINDLKKFIVRTEDFDSLEYPIFHDAITYAESQEKAFNEFTDMGFKVHHIKDVDE